MKYDVIVIGGGNAALCAALAAHEGGARVLILEKAPKDHRGGNSAYTGGAFRVAYEGVDDIKLLVPDLSDDEVRSSDFGSYSQSQFYDEVIEMSGYRADADVLDVVVKQSMSTLRWMVKNGVRFVPIYGRQSFKVDGKHKFWGGLTVEVSGGGMGLMEMLYAKAESTTIDIKYSAQAVNLYRKGNSWMVDVCQTNNSGEKNTLAVQAHSVILATGGFHANLQWRSQYLGKNWDLAKVRGSRFNTGDGIDMAIRAGAIAHGNWTGCHAVFYDLNAPNVGDINLLNQQKNYYTLGIVVNTEGKRFVDEGEEFRNYNYSGMGAKVLAQPSAIAWQIFDAKTHGMLPDEYRVKHVTRLTANTLEELADQIDGINKQAFLKTVSAFNESINQSIPFNPAIKDGRCTVGLEVAKSNWANTIDQGPFVAYAVTCGITFTYGGVKVNTEAEILDEWDRPVGGLYAAGEMVGGLYYIKYPGGAGLTAGSVLGRIAGENASQRSRSTQ